MSHTGTAHPFHMWTKFGDDMSKRSWVMLDKTDRLTDRQTDRQTDKRTYLPKCKFWQVTNERAIGDCVLAKICSYDAHCNDDSDSWNIVYYIDLWLLWKSIGLHVLADDANALYPSTPIRPVLWPGDLVIRPLTLKINRALYSAKMHLCIKFCEAMTKHSWGKCDNFI